MNAAGSSINGQKSKVKGQRSKRIVVSPYPALTFDL